MDNPQLYCDDTIAIPDLKYRWVGHPTENAAMFGCPEPGFSRRSFSPGTQGIFLPFPPSVDEILP